MRMSEESADSMTHGDVEFRYRRIITEQRELFFPRRVRRRLLLSRLPRLVAQPQHDVRVRLQP